MSADIRPPGGRPTGQLVRPDNTVGPRACQAHCARFLGGRWRRSVERRCERLGGPEVVWASTTTEKFNDFSAGFWRSILTQLELWPDPANFQPYCGQLSQRAFVERVVRPHGPEAALGLVPCQQSLLLRR